AVSPVMLVIRATRAPSLSTRTVAHSRWRHPRQRQSVADSSHDPSNPPNRHAGGSLMARIESLQCGHYRVPLPVVLSDSTHGMIHRFELITARVRDADGAEGVGYTYTVGRNGGAVHHILAREIAEIAAGQDADLIEQLWKRLWWDLHYGGRGGPTVLAMSAFDIALWDLKARRARLPLWELLGGDDARLPFYSGGIHPPLSLPRLLPPTPPHLPQGFRPIKMKVGRARLPEDVERVAAMRRHLGDGFPLMVDANMKWSVDEAIRAARALLPFDLVWLEEPTSPDDMTGHVRVAREGGL